MKLPISVKHMQIDKANNMINIVVAASSLIITFSFMSTKALMSQSSYQHKAIAQKNKAAAELKANVSAANTLKTQYDVFEQANPNIIGGQGGNNPGDGPTDGDNARIVLDALPSQYDFPALTSSLEKIVTSINVTPEGITGSDSGDAVNSASGSGSGTSQPTPIAFSVSVTSAYIDSLSLIKDFERSIRPFDITSLTLSGNATKMDVSLQANTYYQPGVSLQIGEKGLK
jgi:hypothetical protein